MKISIDELLQLSLTHKASDIHLTVNYPPTLRINGVLSALQVDNLTSQDTEDYALTITNTTQQQKLKEFGGVDFSFEFSTKARFRVNIFRQRRHYGLVLRVIPTALFSLAKIGLPDTMKQLLFKPRGLILVTGPTGSGKSTTLASMLNIINEERHDHIVTIEDPIEFYHSNKKCIISQREVGVDVANFADALKQVLRQDPDVILVGEMRDLETISSAITAAETGHLVFATLHTKGAAETIDRIVNVFPANEQQQIRTQLASSLLAVISQLLIPRIDQKGRCAALEIMLKSTSISALIRENQIFRITSELQTGAKYGMHTLDDHLFFLYQQGKISEESLLSKCNDIVATKTKLKSLA